MKKIILQMIILFSIFLLMDFLSFAQQSPTSPVARPSTRNTGKTSSSVRKQPTRFNLNSPGGGFGSDMTQQGSSLRSQGMKQKEESDKTKTSETKPKEEKPKEETTSQKEKRTGTKTITGSSGKKEGQGAQQTLTPAPPAGGTTPPTPPGPRTPSMLSGGGTSSGTTPPAPGFKGLLSSIGQAVGATGTTGTQQGGTVPGFFDILFSRKLKYSELPDVGEPLTLPGPMTVGEFLEAIHLATNWNIIVSDGAKDLQMNFWIVDKKPKEALEVLKFYDIFYEFDEKTNFMRVFTKEEWLIKTFGDLKPHEFKIKNADISYMEAIISSLLSGIGKMITDTRTGVIYVWDIEDNINQMEKTVKELDVPLEKKIFTIKHADVSDVETVLTSMLTSNGSLLVDTRSGNIFVWDSPTSLEKMEEVVARLDVPMETRSFSIQYVDVENIADSLGEMISQRGVVQVDPRTNVIIVTDLPSRLDRIGEFIKTLDIRLETRTWVIKYADIDFIADQIENLVPSDMGQVVVDDMTHQITVTALPSRIAEIDELIKTWDIKRKQVLIEAFIVEMDTELERSLGINWSYYGTSGNVPIVIHGGSGVKDIASPSGSGESMSVGQLPSLVPRFGPLTVDNSGNITRPQLQTLQNKPVVDHFLGNNLSVALNYLDRQNKATILSSPRVVVQDGEEAIFENATRVPYISGTAGGYSPYTYNYRQTTSGTTTNNQYNPYYSYPYYGGYYGGYNRVEFIDVGTILSVVPRITEENSILLDISAEDSSYKDKEIKAYDQTSTVPEKTIRHAETQLRVKSGETVVLGGLRRSRSSHLVTKTPLLGDIPLLGKLFRNPSRTAGNNNLLIFITTTVVDEYTHPEAEMLTRAEDKISEDVRYESRNLWGKLHEQAYPDRKSEVRVSVGNNGTLFIGGQKVSLSELPQLLEKEKGKGKKKVLLRKSLRTPDSVFNDIKEIIEKCGLSIEYDYVNEPIVALPGEHSEKDNTIQAVEPSEEKHDNSK
ncbi:MAG: secretin N-terminal domain-containing protein [Candidatus Hydrogenedens sp.]